MRSSQASRSATGFRAALLIGAALPLLVPAIAAAQEASDQVSAVEVVGVTPLPGSGLTKDKIAGPVQTFSGRAIDASNALDFSRFLERTASGVYVNDVQNNPLQPDINYRGYTASPLLGTPQGISVYMDGVRLNQPFGDVVSWDLLPRMAIDKAALIPGSNPLFGLNTLGGALSIQTKSGLSAPGTNFVVAGDNFDGRRAEIESGGSAGQINWYGNFNQFSTNGWRDTSYARDRQGFGKVGWSNDVANVALTVSGAESRLFGNGLQDQRLLALDRTSIYTKPDVAANKSLLVNLTGSYKLSDSVTLSGNVYDRSIRTRTFNGDFNDDALGENLYLAACTSAAPASAACQSRQRVKAAGYDIPIVAPAETIANTPFPFISCVANALLPVPVTPGASGHGEPYEKCDGLINQSFNKQNDRGLSGQFNLTGDLAGRTNLFIAGVSYSENTANFRQTTQFGYLRPDRSVQPVSGPLAFADGSLENDDGELVDNRVNMRGETKAGSVYATNTLEVTPGLSVTLSGRYDQTKVSNLDFITPSGPGSVSGEHKFDRFNPAASVTWQAVSGLNVYAGYSEASRAPTAIELGCSDPANPCRLPNALAGDPPLNQVVAKTVEGGARFALGPLNYTLDAFRSDNDDDILFVADDPSGNGYFKNFGKTRRQGASVGVTAAAGPFTFGANFNYVKATYETFDTLSAEGNSTGVALGCSVNIDPCVPTLAQPTAHTVPVIGNGLEGKIDIHPGDRIPLIPSYTFKLNVDWQVTDKFHVGADSSSVGGSFVRGNENNQHQPDGSFYLGSGRIGGYTVVNLTADYQAYKQVRFFAELNNAFDHRYATAGQLGFTGFNTSGVPDVRHFAAPSTPFGLERPQQGVTFYSPGAPRTIWVGMKVALGGQ